MNTITDPMYTVYMCSALTTCSACKACSIFCFIDAGVIASSAIFQMEATFYEAFPCLRVCSLYTVGVPRHSVQGKRRPARRVWIQLCIELKLAHDSRVLTVRAAWCSSFLFG